MYTERFSNRQFPTHKTFEYLHQQLCYTGSFFASQSNTGHAKTDELLVVEKAIPDVMAAHQVLVHKQLLGRYSDLILRNEHLHPYHVQQVQELTLRDYLYCVEITL